MSFKNETEILTTEEAIRESDLIGIATTAGIFMPVIRADSTSGSLRFTNSHKVGGVEYSERGLLNKESVSWQFVRTNQNTFSTDITTLATPNLQASFVPEGQPILGYIASDAQAMDNEGLLKPEFLLPVPPVGQAFYPYYGAQFLHLSEVYIQIQELGYEDFLILVTAIQRIRYNGATIADFLSITSLLIGDYLQNISFTTNWQNTIVTYYTNSESTLVERLRRFASWEYIIKTQFKRFILEQGEI